VTIKIDNLKRGLDMIKRRGKKKIVDVTGTVLTPGNGGRYCRGNGKHRNIFGKRIECCCDECNDFGSALKSKPVDILCGFCHNKRDMCNNRRAKACSCRLSVGVAKTRGRRHDT
ncbi:MAG: hypothetical protein II359_05755, partial [Clostridia bacterium]|nr:hypothetical protein [Clostridia bacterium]